MRDVFIFDKVTAQLNDIIAAMDSCSDEAFPLMIYVDGKRYASIKEIAYSPITRPVPVIGRVTSGSITVGYTFYFRTLEGDSFECTAEEIRVFPEHLIYITTKDGVRVTNEIICEWIWDPEKNLFNGDF